MTGRTWKYPSSADESSLFRTLMFQNTWTYSTAIRWVTKGAGFLDGSCAAMPSAPCETVAMILPCTLSVGCWCSCLSVLVLAHSIPAITVDLYNSGIAHFLPFSPSIAQFPQEQLWHCPSWGSRANSPSAIRRAQIPPMPCAFRWDVPAFLAP